MSNVISLEFRKDWRWKREFCRTRTIRQLEMTIGVLEYYEEFLPELVKLNNHLDAVIDRLEQEAQA
jgi:hypothetical protein